MTRDDALEHAIDAITRLMTFLAREAGYQDPVAIEPEDERAKLMREFVEAQRALAGMAKRMERAGLMQVAA